MMKMRKRILSIFIFIFTSSYIFFQDGSGFISQASVQRRTVEFDVMSTYEARLTFGYLDTTILLDDDINTDAAIENVKYSSCYLDVYPHMGSGFIIDMTEDYIYVATNKHVAVKNEKEPRIFFYESEGEPAKLIYKATNQDIAFYRVAVADIEEEILYNLKKVILRPKEDSLEVGENIFLAGRNNDKTFYSTQGTVYELNSDCYFEGEGIVRGITTTYTGKPGTSGAGVYDKQGYLVAMNKGRTSSGYGFCISVEDIREEFHNMRSVGKKIRQFRE